MAKFGMRHHRWLDYTPDGENEHLWDYVADQEAVGRDWDELKA
ncbi:MAG: hypothetical protein ACR2FJ_00620 [Qipengyuania sp.]